MAYNSKPKRKEKKRFRFDEERQERTSEKEAQTDLF